MKTDQKIGIVTTGHGPRDEYLHFHKSFLDQTGGRASVIVRNIYDGLSLSQITPHQVDREKPNIGAHVHVEGAQGNRMGDGWEHRFFDRDFAVRCMADTIRVLEDKDQVDFTLLACAAEIPLESLGATRTVVNPRNIIFDLVANLVRWSPRRLRFGVMMESAQVDQDLADWKRQPWYSDLDLVIARMQGDLKKAAAELGREGVDHAIISAYGMGMAPHDPEGQLSEVEALIGAPLIVPHRVTALFLRNLVGPSIDDAAFLPDDWFAREQQGSDLVASQTKPKQK